MVEIVLPNGYNLSMPSGNFHRFPMGTTNSWMQTVAETRRQRLKMLIAKYKKLADLNEAMGYARNDTRLARLRNANARTDRPGKVFNMGDPQAREIEEKLGLERGWMDTPPSLAEQYGVEDPRAKVMLLLESVPEDQWPTAARLIGALTQHTPTDDGSKGGGTKDNGTTG